MHHQSPPPLPVWLRLWHVIFTFSLTEAEAGSGVLLECDSTMKDSILRHLKMYKIRRKVNINSCPDLSVWAVLPQRNATGQEKKAMPDMSTPEKALMCVADPRAEAMGWRLLLDSQVDPWDIIASCQQGDTEEYHRHRYAIGRTKKKVRTCIYQAY